MDVRKLNISMMTKIKLLRLNKIDTDEFIRVDRFKFSRVFNADEYTSLVIACNHLGKNGHPHLLYWGLFSDSVWRSPKEREYII